MHAPEGLGAKPRPDLIGPLFTHLPGTLQDAVRMGFLHSSRPPGRIANRLKAAAQVRFVRHSGNSNGITQLHFEAPTFGSVAGELFDQQQFWEDGPRPEQTAFELLGAALGDMRKRRKDSNRFDLPFLRRISSYSRLLNRGLERIALPDTIMLDDGQIDLLAVTAASELSAAIPPSRRVRVTGRLDVMGASHSVLKLEIRSGVAITALWSGAAPVDSLKEFFNRDVVVEGSGVFRPSGTLLRIDADAIAPATAQDDFFRTVPDAPVLRDVAGMARLRPGEKSAFAKILGSIPPEESDEEFAAAVNELS